MAGPRLVGGRPPSLRADPGLRPGLGSSSCPHDVVRSSHRRTCTLIDADMSGMAAMEYLGALVYEVLDAHEDTMRLANCLSNDDQCWAAHLDYLRDLQRVGRERLARAGTSPV